MFVRHFVCYARLLCLSFILPLPLFSASDQAPVKSSGALTFYLDTASFRAGGGKTHQEFYYQIALEQLRLQPTTGLGSEIKTWVLLSDSAGRELLRDEWTQTVQVGTAAEIAGRFFPNQFELPLSPGRYRLALAVEEVATQKQGSAQIEFRACAFDDARLTISDIQLANSITADTTSGRFTKNGLSILPNASRVYSRGVPLLYFYFEIYNFSALADSYEVKYSVVNSSKAVLKQLPTKIARKPGGSSVEVGGLNLGGLSDSIGSVQVEVRERSQPRPVLAEKRFAFLLPPARMISEAEQKIAVMSEEEWKTHLEQIQYLLREDDKKLLQDLEPEAQRSFVIQMWKQFDSNPATPRNEFWDEYLRRVAYANEKFTSGFTTGWKTDRGRIAMKFGIPSEVERHPAETDARPYEVWIYYSEGRKQFIFADLEGLGRYELIFSSDERELTRPDWKLLINAQ